MNENPTDEESIVEGTVRRGTDVVLAFNPQAAEALDELLTQGRARPRGTSLSPSSAPEPTAAGTSRLRYVYREAQEPLPTPGQHVGFDDRGGGVAGSPRPTGGLT
jgi:hypothetical protein